MRDSIVVGAHLTPEEVEEGQINDAYQPLYHLSNKTDCPQIVSLCETKIIPMAHAAKSDINRNKFLYLANRDIAACEMNSHQYAQAEQRYQTMFDYIPVWPGKDDSDYPINYRDIGLARLGQEKWKTAVESLQKSISIFNEQISKAESGMTEHADYLRGSLAAALNFLGIAFYRDGQTVNALQALEQAYQEAVNIKESRQLLSRIIQNARDIALASGDVVDAARWEARSLRQ